MDASADRRLRIGQLLVNHMRLFREALYRRTIERGFTDLRPAHLQVFGSIKADGSRLTDLADWTNMGRSSMAELVDDLEAKGYVERRPDPSDGRAKLICLTDHGWRTMRAGREVIEEIEADYAERIGRERFEVMCRDLEHLLDKLDPNILASYRVPPPGQEEDAGSENSEKTRSGDRLTRGPRSQSRA